MWQSWEQWLQLPPATQQVNLDSELEIAPRFSLKPSSTSFEWSLTGLSNLITEIQQQLILSSNTNTDVETGLELKSAKLLFQPLPRTQKIALPGRVGRKSGKKLLQALDLPSFMRPSVVLCSIQLSSQVEEIPLLLITPERILALQSQFAPSIQQLIEDNNLLSEVRNL